VFDRSEVVRVEFGEERIGNAQSWIMHAQIFFEDFATMVDFLQTPHRRRSATVVASKIDQRLFALENCGGA
jgi:hypothetical protein